MFSSSSSSAQSVRLHGSCQYKRIPWRAVRRARKKAMRSGAPEWKDCDSRTDLKGADRLTLLVVTF